MVGAVSEIRPLRTEEALTDASVGVDDLDGVAAKSTTTVAMDFGRITLRDGVAIYLFGTPGQERFWFMWNELSRGALGAVVLADTRRLADCFGAGEFFERRGIRFLVALNEFADGYRYEDADVRQALALKPHVPLVRCDARNTPSASRVLITLLESVLAANRVASPMIRSSQ
jgi:signal recognition particle receptor subunit beta